MQYDPDTSDLTPWENLSVVKAYVEGGERSSDGRDKTAAIRAINALPDQIEWIERGIVEWREAAQKHLKALHMEMAKTRVAISRLQTLLNGQIDENQRLAAETAARDWMVANGGAVYQYKNANLPTGPKVGRSLNAKASG